MSDALPDPDESGLPGDLAHLVIDAAASIRDAADEAGVTLCLAGSMAVWELCPTNAPLLAALGRRQYRDLDYVGYSKEKRGIERIFDKLGYKLDPTIRQSQEFGIKRYIYHAPSAALKVDIFLDRLVMAHTIDFDGRLPLRGRTITVTDLLLTKLQIHEITENDLIDLVVLLAEHELQEREDGGIDARRIVRVLSEDWGFWYTTVGNLAKVEEALERYRAIEPAIRAVVAERVADLRARLEASSKSTRWKLRARVGPRVRWYEDVDEVRA